MGSLSMVTTESLPALYNNNNKSVSGGMHETDTIVIRNCRTSGLGIKIIGGKSTVGEADYGIFVKKILVGGRAESEGHLEEGDQLLEANGESMLGVSNDKAISILRNAAESNQARLVISRDSQARREFTSLMSAVNHGTLTSSNSFGGLNGPGALELMRSASKDSSRASTPSPTMGKRSWVMSGGRMSPLALGRHGSPNWSPSSSIDRQPVGLQRMQAVDYASADALHNPGSVDPPPYLNSLRLANLPSTSSRNGTTSYAHHNGDGHPSGISPKHAAAEQQSDSEVTIDSGLPTDRRSASSSPTFDNPGELQVVRIPVVNGLGLCIVGGTNRQDGPHIYVDNMIEGGDAQRDNRLRRGDQLVTVVGETLVGLTHEQAKSLLTRLKLRRDITDVEIAFIRGGHNSSVNRSPSQPLLNGHSPGRSPVAGSRSPGSGSRSPLDGSGSPMNGLSLRQSQLADLQAQIDSNPSSSRSSTENGLSNPDVYLSELQLPSSSSDNTGIPNTNSRPEVDAQYPGYLNSQQDMMPQMQAPGVVHQQPYGHSLNAGPQRNGGGFQPTMASTPAFNGLPHGQTSELAHYNGYGPARPPTIHQPYSLPSGTFQISPVTPSLQPSSVPFYLQQDLEALGRVTQQYAPPSVSQQSSPRGPGQQLTPEGQQSSPGRSRQSRHDRSGRRLSLDPYTRLKVEKLEVALRYLGFEPTEEQQRELRARLPIDHNGCATYGDFVSIAQQIFSMRLKDPNLSTSALQFAMHDINALEKKQQNIQMESQQQLSVAASHPPQPSEDMERLRRERDEALREVQHLRKILKKKEDECMDTSEEAMKSRLEAQALLEESRSMQNRIHLASQAQRAAKDMEQDYEEVIKLLEKEMAALKTKLEHKGPDPKQLEELQKRLVVLGCQLRKSEVSKRTYEVATDKLIHFAELVHDVLQEGGPGMPPQRGKGESAKRDKSGTSRPPSYLGRHAKLSPTSLAKEARDTVKTIKALIEEEPLPFGWEEAYHPDGVRYYINHVTQQTSWLHPVSQVQHLPAITEKNESETGKDGVRETRT